MRKDNQIRKPLLIAPTRHSGNQKRFTFLKIFLFFQNVENSVENVEYSTIVKNIDISIKKSRGG